MSHTRIESDRQEQRGNSAQRRNRATHSPAKSAIGGLMSSRRSTTHHRENDLGEEGDLIASIGRTDIDGAKRPHTGDDHHSKCRPREPTECTSEYPNRVRVRTT